MASFQGGDVNPPTFTTNAATSTVLPPVLGGAAAVATAGINTTQVAITLSSTGGTLTRRSTSST